jgi:hypothetical protein
VLSLRKSVGMKSSILAPLLFLLPAFAQAPKHFDPTANIEVISPLPQLRSYRPISGSERLQWFAVSTAGPSSLLLTGPLSAGWGTMLNRPKEYQTHWNGFGKRYGMRLTGISTGNAMEAALGSIWGEDPRYFRSPQRGFGTRVRYVLWSSFMAPHRDGSWHPAYARYIGNVGNNVLSNTWRAHSESNASATALRCLFGIIGEMSGNAFNEFWPDVWKKLSHK